MQSSNVIREISSQCENFPKIRQPHRKSRLQQGLKIAGFGQPLQFQILLALHFVVLKCELNLFDSILPFNGNNGAPIACHSNYDKGLCSLLYESLFNRYTGRSHGQH
jgi:hypothetical protein